MQPAAATFVLGCFVLSEPCRLAAQTTVLQSAAVITPASIMRHIRTLASDEFEGRGPGSTGETKTVEYLIDQFREFGLQPGNPDRTYIQRVPISIIKSSGTATFHTATGMLRPSNTKETLIFSYRDSPLVRIKRSAVVFAGYGVSAPAANWDDYQGIDVRGKTVLVISNDPFAETASPDRAMPPMPALYRQYHTNNRVKIDEATKRGATAIILIRNTGESEGAWQVILNTRRELAIATDTRRFRASVEGFIRVSALENLLKGTAWDYTKLLAEAGRPGFRAIPLPVTADFAVRSEHRKFNSQNVVACVTGSDPVLRRQFVVYTAHWDALGRDLSRTGDQIFNGALDDAGGTAQMLEIAHAFATVAPKPRRSVLFIATTAEEKGIIGSKYYVSHPLYPLDSHVAVINLDGIQVHGVAADMVSAGGRSSLNPQLEKIAKANGRVFSVVDSPLYYTSDHLPFAVAGVPALFPASGILPLEANKALKARRGKGDSCVHQPCDEVHEDWDLTGAAQDSQIWFQLGYEVAQADKAPSWDADWIWHSTRRLRH